MPSPLPPAPADPDEPPAPATPPDPVVPPLAPVEPAVRSWPPAPCDEHPAPPANKRRRRVERTSCDRDICLRGSGAASSSGGIGLGPQTCPGKPTAHGTRWGAESSPAASFPALTPSARG